MNQQDEQAADMEIQRLKDLRTVAEAFKKLDEAWDIDDQVRCADRLKTIVASLLYDKHGRFCNQVIIDEEIEALIVGEELADNARRDKLNEDGE